jgi:hypothetical protein
MLKFLDYFHFTKYSLVLEVKYLKSDLLDKAVSIANLLRFFPAANPQHKYPTCGNSTAHKLYSVNNPKKRRDQIQLEFKTKRGLLKASL